MTNLIRLTIADTNGTQGIAGQEVYVNPAQITHFYVYPAINATVVVLSGEDLWDTRKRIPGHDLRQDLERRAPGVQAVR